MIIYFFLNNILVSPITKEPPCAKCIVSKIPPLRQPNTMHWMINLSGNFLFSFIFYIDYFFTWLYLMACMFFFSFNKK